MADIDSHERQVENLFARLAEQVKLPFIQVLHAAELLSESSAQAKHSQRTIHEVSQAAIQLIDGYLLQVRLQQESQLQLESVSVSSVLYETAELLSPYAKLHNCELQLNISGKYGPVMAHASGLQAALANIGYSLIDATDSNKQRRTITLGVRRDMKGLSAGVYAEGIELTSGLLKQAKAMHGTIHQPMTGFSSTNAAGIFVADGLLTSLGAPLRVAKFRGMPGFAATFLPSRQLSLV